MKIITRKYTAKMLQNPKESFRLLTFSAFLTIASKIEKFPSENQLIIRLKVSMFLALGFDDSNLGLSMVFDLGFR